MAKRRKTIRVELTQGQIDKLWPLFQAVASDNAETQGARRLAVLGQARVEDNGKVTGWAQWTVLTAEEAAAVAVLLKSEG